MSQLEPKMAEENNNANPLIAFKCGIWRSNVKFGQCLRRILKNRGCSWSNWDETCH